MTEKAGWGNNPELGIVLVDAVSMKKGQWGKTGTPPWLLTERQKPSQHTSPQDLAAECPMPLRALTGPRAVVLMVPLFPLVFRLPTMLESQTVVVRSGQ